LAEGYVKPRSRSRTTQFQYTVIYQDPDADMPAVHDVLIDGNAYPMQPSGGEPLAGMAFQHTAALSPGPHAYRFRFDDGHGHLVETAEFQGPMVQ
jgi:hypothetical protein